MRHYSIIILFALSLFLPDTYTAQVLPTKFIENQIFLTPKLKDGRELMIFSDTGGGWNAIAKELYDQYHWPTIIKQSENETITLSAMPEFMEGYSIPLAGLNNFMQGYLFIVERKRLAKLHRVDGFLGGRWHAEKILQFNYPMKQLILHANLEESISKKWHKLSLGFQKNNQDNYTTAFPSVEIAVEGKVYAVLLDTGASAHLSEEAKIKLKTNANVIGTSYIIGSVFDAWRSQHPEWLIIENGDELANSAMIRVPEVKIGSKKIGPVWFTRREDKNFHQFMSTMMDRKVDGAIGGSLFQYLNMVVDYPNEVLFIEP